MTEQRLLKMCNWEHWGRKCIPTMMFSTICRRLKIQREGACGLFIAKDQKFPAFDNLILDVERLELEMFFSKRAAGMPFFLQWEP